MAFKDILLTLTSYPDPTPVSVVEDAVSIAATLGAHLVGRLLRGARVEVPGHFLPGSIANLPGIIAGEAEKSRKQRQRPARRIRRGGRKSRRSARDASWKNARPIKYRTSWSTTPGCAISPSCRCRNPTTNGTRRR